VVFGLYGCVEGLAVLSRYRVLARAAAELAAAAAQLRTIQQLRKKMGKS